MKDLILIVDDEKPIRNFIKVAMETQNYQCIETESGIEGLSLAASHNPDIIILDLGLPDLDGLEIIKKIREWSNLPIIVVSARGHEREKIDALDLGADDYLTKPFSVAELLARVRVALRHNKTAKSPEKVTVFNFKNITIDFDKRTVKLNNKEIHFTPTEYNILTLLAKYQGKVLTHRYIINEVWNGFSEGDTQTLRVCMGNIRRKIEEDTAQPKYILTEVGIGYRMSDT